MKTLKNYIPTIIEEIWDSIEYEENGEMIISSINYSSNDLTVKFDLFYDGYENPKQQWQIIIKEIKSEKIVREWTRYFSFYSDHYLLYEFTSPFAELYFSGKAKDSEKLFIDLYKSHMKNYYGDFLSFGLGINPAMNILKLCNHKAGLFASGPKKILEKYQEVLLSSHIKSNFIVGNNNATNDLKLLIFGNSYFIGKEFLFTKL